MWPFRKKPEVDLTLQGYEQWLRAGRPPLFWFMAQAEGDREAMADAGDRIAADRSVALGYAVRDPAAAAAGFNATGGDMDAEAEIVQRLAAQAFQKMTAPPPAPAPAAPPRPVMRGTGRKVSA